MPIFCKPHLIPIACVAVGLSPILLFLALRDNNFVTLHPSDSSVTSTLPASTTPVETQPKSTDAVRLRPLPVALTSGTHEWTQDDATLPEVIEKIAHNPEEFIRLVEENELIKRRQLVYRKDIAAAVVQRARTTGETIRSLTLPGLDGQEIHVEVTASDLAHSGLSGTFTGRVAGKQLSIVTLAFKLGREAYSVSSPEDNLYLEAEPREPNEVLIKEIDPATYVSGKCGNPDHNH
ncbi:MAG: hypothetical protein V4640_12525 [Verrucomicrobiota bacterium]